MCSFQEIYSYLLAQGGVEENILSPYSCGAAKVGFKVIGCQQGCLKHKNTCSLLSAVINKSHRSGGLNGRNFVSFISGGQKSEIKVWTRLVSSKTSFQGLRQISGIVSSWQGSEFDSQQQNLSFDSQDLFPFLVGSCLLIISLHISVSDLIFSQKDTRHIGLGPPFDFI